MGAGAILLTLLAIVGVPIVAFIVLAVAGAASLLGASLAIAATMVAGVGLALLWCRDLEVLSETVQRLSEERPPAETPVLPWS